MDLDTTASLIGMLFENIKGRGYLAEQPEARDLVASYMKERNLRYPLKSFSTYEFLAILAGQLYERDQTANSETVDIVEWAFDLFTEEDIREATVQG